MAPTLIGWVVFAADLDAREMRGSSGCRRFRSTPRAGPQIGRLGGSGGQHAALGRGGAIALEAI
jgi:hypothetical protein